MKPRCSKQRNQALTITEVLVVVAMLCVLVVVAVADVDESLARSQRINCINNLKQIGLSFRLWAGDNNDQFPAQVPAKLGGAMEAAVRGNVAPIFQVMSNELNTPKMLVCPADSRRSAADNFTTGFDNSHISYFVGVDASDSYPQRLLSGDSNLAVDDKPVPPGLLNLSTNASVTWTADRHVNQGNIGRADGSVAQSSLPWLPLHQLLTETGLATNRLAIP